MSCPEVESCSLKRFSFNFSGFDSIDVRKVLNMDIDCGSEICQIVYKILPTCHMYIAPPHSTCKIPCSLDECKIETFHNIRCPIIHCTPKTTTTTPFTTTLPFPTPSPNSDCSGPLCISSLVFNAIFLVAIISVSVFAIRSFRKFRMMQRANHLLSRFDEERVPIIRGFANVNLSSQASELNSRQSTPTVESPRNDTRQFFPLLVSRIRLLCNRQPSRANEEAETAF